MQFKTQQMEFTRALDEVFLRLSLVILRGIQAFVTTPIIGFAASLVNDFSTADELRVPSKATAALAIACVCAAYTVVSFLPIFFEGVRFFTALTLLDGLFAAGWVVLVAVWDCDGSSSCSAFRKKYFQGLQYTRQFDTDCKIVKALFAFLIINLILFVVSAIISFCLRSLELKHTTSWRTLPLIEEYGKHRRRQCHCHCHTQSAPDKA